MNQATNVKLNIGCVACGEKYKISLCFNQITDE